MGILCLDDKSKLFDEKLKREQRLSNLLEKKSKSVHIKTFSNAVLSSTSNRVPWESKRSCCTILIKKIANVHKIEQQSNDKNICDENEINSNEAIEDLSSFYTTSTNNEVPENKLLENNIKSSNVPKSKRMQFHSDNDILSDTISNIGLHSSNISAECNNTKTLTLPTDSNNKMVTTSQNTSQYFSTTICNSNSPSLETNPKYTTSNRLHGLTISHNDIRPAHELRSFDFANISTVENIINACSNVNQRIVPYSDSDTSDTFSPLKTAPSIANINERHINTLILLPDSGHKTPIPSDTSFASHTISPISTSNNNIYSSTRISENTMNSGSFHEITSICEDRTSISDYIPEFSSSKDILSNSANRDDSVNVIDMPLNVEEISVPYSKSKLKRHFCIFCKKLQCAIGRHLLLKHKQEVEVKKALDLPKKSKQRLKIISTLRKQGDFEHNTSANHNTGVLIVSRRQQSKFKNNADDYVCCKKCKGFFSKKTLRIHAAGCIKSKNKKSNLIESRRLTQYIHPVANNTLRTKIFPVLRNDDISRAIRYDELVIKFGNKLAEKYAPLHQHDMIRANLRVLGRFMIEIKRLDTDIKELKEIFNPNVFDKCIVALRNVAGWNEEKMWFNAPAVAQNLTSLIKKCGKKQRAEYIKEHAKDLILELNNFLLLWEEEIPTVINKKAVEDQTNKKIIKKVILPSKEDIKKLYNHLKEKIAAAIEELSQKFSISSWIKLLQATLVFIQVFNRRRAGEIERLTTENFANKEIITDSIDKDVLKNYSLNSINFAKQFVRITLRGKLGRTVSVLLCPMCIKAVDLILKFRVDAGITPDNNYIFSKTTTSNLTKPYYRACPLLKMFSEECGAQIPESLRGTTLRKHIATYMSMLNIEEASVERLANFMGHHKDIHKNIYRQSIPVAEIACVSKLLTVAVGNEVDDEEDAAELDEEETHGLNDSLFETRKDSSSSSNRKRRSTSPFGKTKRCRWTTAEKKAIYSVFGEIKNLKNLPSLQECFKAIRQSPALYKRTPQQIKSWIDNQRRKNTDLDATI